MNRKIAALTLASFLSSSLSPAWAWAQTYERFGPEAAVLQEPGEHGVPAGVDDWYSTSKSSLDDAERLREPADPRDQTNRITADLTRGPLAEPRPDAPPEPLDLPAGGDKSGVTSQSISVPKGSGKVDGMGESFSTQLSTGVATFSVPLALPAARGAVQPKLALAYSSAAGSGVAGMGWSLGVPFVARQTDRGLPGYDDRGTWHPNQDRFVFNGGQELVPICTVSEALDCACTAGADGVCRGGALDGERMPPWSAGSQYFRARVEGSFLRFFWSADHLTWRVQDKSGVTLELGVPLDGSGESSALDRNPDNPREIYRWHLARQYDTYGGANPPDAATPATPVNVVVYKYLKDGGAAYLSDIFATTPMAAPATTDVARFAHHTRLVYEKRPDPTFSYRTGWRIDQALRLARVDVTSKTFNEGESAPRRLVGRYHLGYDSDVHVSLLASVEVEGRCSGLETDAPAEDGTGAIGAITGCGRLPPMRFGYSHVVPFATDGSADTADLAGYEGFDARVRRMTGDPPHSIDESLAELFDIDADALPDLLVTAPGTYGNDHAVFFNSAKGVADGFGAVEHMGVAGVLGANSTTIKLSNLNLAPLDLDGDGTVDLLHMPKAKTYSIYAPELKSGAWKWVGREVTTANEQNPKLDFGKDTLDIKVVDVNFDGLVDVVASTGTQFQTFFSLGRFAGGDGQFGNARWTSPVASSIANDPIAFCVPHSGNAVRLSDPDIHLAEMNGDGVVDIVRIRRGDIRYWPGRGNGFWGVGRRDACLADPDEPGTNRHLAMADSPFYSDFQGTTLRIDDVNGDGLDDLVQVRADAVDVWLNVDGTGWTERHVIRDTPPAPAYSNRVRLVDVNGSGTRDILWGDGRDYKYIDLQGGKKSWLLTRVENGLGKSTDIEYTTSTAEMLAAEKHAGPCDGANKPWSSPWCKKMPIVAHVVKRVTESDNLTIAGNAPGAYVTEYSYRDPVFEGRQREFRGFEKVRSKRIGDANSPTDFTESTFLLGECKDETVGARDNDTDDCSAGERWRDNPREALKGLPILSERYDENGVYLSTEAMTYRLRRLYLGLDGREVRHAFESSKRSILYDTALGAATAPPATVPLASVEFELELTDFDVEQGDPLALPQTVSIDQTRAVPVRQSAGRAEIASSSVVDGFGNRIVAVAHGCVAGSACPTAEAGMKTDQPILSYTVPIELPQGETGWLWRTERSFVTDLNRTVERVDTVTTYTAEGDPDETIVTLDGTLPLERVVAESLPATASVDGPITISRRSYSNLGSLIEESGANGRCREVGYDESYGELATSESIHRNASGACDDPAPLVIAAAYDRGLAQVTTHVDMQGQSTFARYDGFGRLSEVDRPTVGAGQGSPVPSLRLEYFLPSPNNPVSYSVIHTMVQDGATSFDAAYLESYAYVDGLGRTLLTLSEADESAGDEGAWIASALQEYDRKGAVRRKYLDFYYDGAPLEFPLAALPTGPYGGQRYDAFGRQAQTFDLDGTVTLQSRYHALSTDLFDAADIEAGPHQDTPASTRQDGHGRAIATTERVHVGGAIEERHTRTQYLITGEPEVITRVRGSGTETVTRWMRYDTLGRMVLNVEPNTTENFNPDPATDPMPGQNGLKAWRYAYNDAGDLVGTSDARGCGQTFFYDGAGRLVAEDYARCESHHTAYSSPDLASGTGTEVLYVYDSVPGSLAPPPNYVPNASSLRGRLAAVFSRGSTVWTTYDFLGRVVRSDVRVVKPGPISSALSDRYTGSWYSKEFAYDAADREVATTTGSTLGNLQGQSLDAYGFDPARDGSVVTTQYTARGTVKSVGGSYGTLVRSIDRTADGLITQIVHGDGEQVAGFAGTTTDMAYDERRRLRSVQTYRGPPEIWTSPPGEYLPAPAPNSTTSFQLLLQDEDYSYDSVNNPTLIRDWRNAEEWPDGAKPVTRKIQYDDLYRVRRVDYQHPGGYDTWTSPFAPELGGSEDYRRAQPSPHVSFERRVQWQTFEYDWLGNTSETDDDGKGFYDRSLGTVTNDSAGGKPYQLKSATNEAAGGTRTGAAGTLYDAAGNLIRLDVKRNGPCLDGMECSQRFDYRWDEVGRLVQARRWDVAGASITTPDAGLPPDANVAADLAYVYDDGDQRVLKVAKGGTTDAHTLYIFDSLELRRTAFSSGVYQPTTGVGFKLTEMEVPYLLANGARLGRVVYEQETDSEPRLAGNARQHVFLQMGDHLGSTSMVIDKATSELVARGTYQPYGAPDSDYRPDRWEGFREDYRFTGKEEDIEVGLTYFGKRFLSSYLGRWLSADPLTIHALGTDLNAYAYVSGRVLKNVDPLGLQTDEATPEDGTEGSGSGPSKGAKASGDAGEAVQSCHGGQYACDSSGVIAGPSSGTKGTAGGSSERSSTEKMTPDAGTKVAPPAPAAPRGRYVLPKQKPISPHNDAGRALIEAVDAWEKQERANDPAAREAQERARHDAAREHQKNLRLFEKYAEKPKPVEPPAQLASPESVDPDWNPKEVRASTVKEIAKTKRIREVCRNVVLCNVRPEDMRKDMLESVQEGLETYLKNRDRRLFDSPYRSNNRAPMR